MQAQSEVGLCIVCVCVDNLPVPSEALTFMMSQYNNAKKRLLRSQAIILFSVPRAQFWIWIRFYQYMGSYYKDETIVRLSSR